MRKSAKLARQRAAPRQHQADYSLFDDGVDAVESKKIELEESGRIRRNRDVEFEVEERVEVHRPRRRVIYPELVESQLERFYDTYSL